MLPWKSPPLKMTWDLRLWDRHREWWKIININKDNTFQLHSVFYSLALQEQMVKLAATPCLQQEAETTNCSEELLVNADGFFPYKKKDCNGSCTCKEYPRNITGETVCQDSFFSVLFVESNRSWKTKVKSNLSFPKCKSLTHYWKKCLCCRFLLKG